MFRVSCVGREVGELCGVLEGIELKVWEDVSETLNPKP